MRLIVVGASGLIGGALMAEARASGAACVGTCRSRPHAGLRPFDATRQPLAHAVLDLGRDDCVALLAAHVDPEWVRQHAEEARALNVTATQALIDEAHGRGAAVLFLSSEAVFDGTAGGYIETDEPCPLTLYARQKVEIERYLAASRGRWCVARTGWTVDAQAVTGRCPVEGTYDALLRQGARMARDNVFTITDVRDTARALLTLATRDAHGIYHIASTPAVARTELAGWVRDASRHGGRMAFEESAFADLRFPEPRPARPWIRADKIAAETGIRFRSPRDIVGDKVAVMDLIAASATAVSA